MDLVVEGGLPWAAPQCRKAATVHVGGGLDEVVQAAAEVDKGRMPERPFVVVTQPALGDPRREIDGRQPVGCLVQVPADVDRAGAALAEVVLDRIERFAPGARDRVVAVEPAPPTAHDRDADEQHLVRIRPRAPRSRDPYGLGVPGMYICSAATPPGGVAHGLCGHGAARKALYDLHHPPA